MKHQKAFCIMRQEIKNNAVYSACMAFSIFPKEFTRSIRKYRLTANILSQNKIYT